MSELQLEVLEESLLWSVGGGFRSPDSTALVGEAGTDVGWPFAAWVLRQWFDAGFIALYDFTRGNAILSDEVSRGLVEDPSRWSVTNPDSAMSLVRTDTTDDLHFEDWLQILGSFEDAPPIGEDPLQAASRAAQIAGG